jgi:hypothetical protein
VSTGGRRFAALAVAAVLVGGAVVVRNATRADPPSTEPRPRLLCASELADACAAIGREADVEIVSKPSGVSVAELSSRADEDKVDGWLAPAPQAQIVDYTRGRTTSLESLFGTVSNPIARSPLVVLVWKERGAKLAAQCLNTVVTWKCLGDTAGDEWASIGGQPGWGTVRITHDDPAASAVGLLTMGQEAVSYFNRSNLTNDDFDEGTFDLWFTNLEDNVNRYSSDNPVERMLGQGVSSVDAVGTTEAAVCRTKAGAALGPDAKVVVPTPVATVDVVYAPIGRTRRSADLGEIVTGDTGRRALAAAGWRVDGMKTTGGTCARAVLPAQSDDLPPGNLVALQQRRPGG